MKKRSRFMTSAERKAAQAPAPAPTPVASTLPVWDPAGDEEFNGYRHAPKADKGKRDGSCNRTACQAPLKGRTQFYMRADLDPTGRVYYCEPCADMFTDADRRFQPHLPLRCTRLVD